MPAPHRLLPHVRLGCGTLISLCLLLPGAAEALHNPTDPGLSSSEQKCLNEVNKNAAKVAMAQGKVVCDCIKNGAKGRLGGQTIEQCLTSDNRGKVRRSRSKLTANKV